MLLHCLPKIECTPTVVRHVEYSWLQASIKVDTNRSVVVRSVTMCVVLLERLVTARHFPSALARVHAQHFTLGAWN